MFTWSRVLFGSATCSPAVIMTKNKNDRMIRHYVCTLDAFVVRGRFVVDDSITSCYSLFCFTVHKDVATPVASRRKEQYTKIDHLFT